MPQLQSPHGAHRSPTQPGDTPQRSPAPGEFTDASPGALEQATPYPFEGEIARVMNSGRGGASWFPRWERQIWAWACEDHTDDAGGKANAEVAGDVYGEDTVEEVVLSSLDTKPSEIAGHSASPCRFPPRLEQHLAIAELTSLTGPTTQPSLTAYLCASSSNHPPGAFRGFEKKGRAAHGGGAERTAVEDAQVVEMNLGFNGRRCRGEEMEGGRHAGYRLTGMPFLAWNRSKSCPSLDIHPILHLHFILGIRGPRVTAEWDAPVHGFVLGRDDRSTYRREPKSGFGEEGWCLHRNYGFNFTQGLGPGIRERLGSWGPVSRALSGHYFAASSPLTPPPPDLQARAYDASDAHANIPGNESLPLILLARLQEPRLALCERTHSTFVLAYSRENWTTSLREDMGSGIWDMHAIAVSPWRDVRTKKICVLG
ncbi:hypothetical protein FIBSPDRAFT_885242 [Athelia psychrophila]|uniref:Uncharacterized protein n=1 Tax=Athelia psychrophila TaxID=1759441 RepID=A0A166S8T8_9AGAM|nr:hypothetical protein FIBSPDRAFT_885242 [Fibularhizoctonia sp. CBS 109695]